MFISWVLFVFVMIELIGMMLGPLVSLANPKATSKPKRGFAALGFWFIHYMVYSTFMWFLDERGGPESLLSSSHYMTFVIASWVAALVGLGMVIAAFRKKLPRQPAVKELLNM